MDHGFGGIKIQSDKLSPQVLDDIAKCISTKPDVLWAHVVHKGFHYYSEEGKLLQDPHVEDRYQIIIEMTRNCDPNEISKCVHEIVGPDHKVTYDKFAIKDTSYKRGNPGKHPKEEDIESQT